MRISRVESWYSVGEGMMGKRDSERAQGVTKDASDGRKGWEFGEVR